jgi:hypothetical protein
LRHLQGARVQPVARLTESPRDRQQRQRHARHADREQRLAAQPINEPDRNDSHDHVDQADDHGLAERVAHAAAGLREYRRQVVEDRVDAGDLLKEGESEGDQHDEADAPVEQGAPAVRDVPRGETLADLLQTLLRLRGTVDARQHIQCRPVPPLDHEPSRTLRNQ